MQVDGSILTKDIFTNNWCKQTRHLRLSKDDNMSNQSVSLSQFKHFKVKHARKPQIVHLAKYLLQKETKIINLYSKYQLLKTYH